MDNILVINDEKTKAENLSPTLADLGFNVITASTPEEGLQAFRTHEPFLVIVDCDPVSISTRELMEKLVRDEVPKRKYSCHFSSPPSNPHLRNLTLREANFYVILLVETYVRNQMMKFRELGIDYILVKPVHLFTLQGIINTIHRLKTTRDDLCKRFSVPRSED